MVMRNTPVSDVLRRRMFMTGPQFDRNDPVGIMGSSPELMQAVMRNQPQLAPMATDFTGEPIMYPAGQNYGRRGDRRGEATPIEITAPGAGTSAKRRRGGNRNNRQAHKDSPLCAKTLMPQISKEIGNKTENIPNQEKS